MNDVKYRTAEDADGKKIDISDVTDEMQENEKFFCRICHKPMSAVIHTGDRQIFFRHKVENPNCSKESYLHLIAKETLQKRFNSSQEFIISLHRKFYCDLRSNCPNNLDCNLCYNEELDKFDLKKYYDKCILEERDKKSGLIPDLMLVDSNGKHTPIWLEINVSHPCSEQKKNSGARIIEFKIKTEEQALALKTIEIRETQNCWCYSEQETDPIDICFFNFNRDAKETIIINKQYQSRALLLSNGYIQFRDFSCRDNWNELSNNAIASIEFPYSYNPSSTYKARSIFASMSIGNFRACTWCKNSKLKRDGSRYCRCHNYLRLPNVPYNNEAYYCDRYDPIFDAPKIQVVIKKGLSLQALQEMMKDKPTSPPKPVYQKLKQEDVKPEMHRNDLEQDFPQTASSSFTQVITKIGEESFAKWQKDYDNISAERTFSRSTSAVTSAQNEPKPQRIINEIYLSRFCKFIPHPEPAKYGEWDNKIKITLIEWRGYYLREIHGKEKGDIIPDECIIASLREYLKEKFIEGKFGNEEEFEEWYNAAFSATP